MIFTIVSIEITPESKPLKSDVEPRLQLKDEAHCYYIVTMCLNFIYTYL